MYKGDGEREGRGQGEEWANGETACSGQRGHFVWVTLDGIHWTWEDWQGTIIGLPLPGILPTP